MRWGPIGRPPAARAAVPPRRAPPAVPPRGSAGRRSGCSQLVDRRDLDEELLRPRLLELHVRDAFGALSGHRGDAALAEVGVADAVPRRQLQVAVIADLAGDAVGPLGLRPLL